MNGISNVNTFLETPIKIGKRFCGVTWAESKDERAKSKKYFRAKPNRGR
jgi:hypothetical protein